MERSKDLFSLHGKVSIVTGAGRGLGNGIALALAGAGSDLVLAARSTHELERISQKIITDTKRKVFPLSLDLTKEGEIERLITSVLDEFGRIDVLVNNAGTNVRKPFLEIT
jgi:short-subunit dehydrogenase